MAKQATKHKTNITATILKTFLLTLRGIIELSPSDHNKLPEQFVKKLTMPINIYAHYKATAFAKKLVLISHGNIAEKLLLAEPATSS